MKTINYRGEDYIVEDWVNFVATDDNGDVWGYENEPYKDHYCWMKDGGDYSMIYQSGAYWENSLEKV